MFVLTPIMYSNSNEFIIHALSSRRAMKQWSNEAIYPMCNTGKKPWNDETGEQSPPQQMEKEVMEW